MTILRQSRRSFLKSAASGRRCGAISRRGCRQALQERRRPAVRMCKGLRDKIDHIIVIYQENRSFDHYFGAYQPPGGAAVANLLDHVRAKSTRALPACKRTRPACPTAILPVPSRVPGFANALIENRPFHLTPYIRPDDNALGGTRPITSSAWRRRSTMARWTASCALALPRQASILRQRRRTPTPVADDAGPVDPVGRACSAFTRAQDLPFYHHLADEYVLFDHFFQAMTGGSTGNALYLAAARSAERGRAARRPLPAA